MTNNSRQSEISELITKCSDLLCNPFLNLHTIAGARDMQQLSENYRSWKKDTLKFLNILGYYDCVRLIEDFNEPNNLDSLNKQQLYVNLTKGLHILMLSQLRSLLLAITLDTNGIVDYADGHDSQKAKAIETIIFAHANNKINLKTIKSPTRSDISRDGNQERFKNTMRFLARIPELDISTDQHSTPHELDSKRKELCKILFKKECFDSIKAKDKDDIEHLLWHILAKRDFFVTCDCHFLNKKAEIKSELGAAVVNPEECIEEILSS